MWSERRDDVEEVYDGCGELLLLATRRSLTEECKESSEVRCWRGFGALFFQGRLDCSQDNGRLIEVKVSSPRIRAREEVGVLWVS